MAEAQAPAPVPPPEPAAPEAVIQAPMRPAPPPKPLGNAGKDFRAGDFVVYPTHGVGQVQGIEDVPIAGQTLKVITVTFEENRMTLKVPMAKAASSGLRKLASEKVMGEAMETLRGRARIKRTMWSRRAQEYEQKINSGDPIAIAEVVRDLHRNAGQPDQSFSERQIYELALERLAAEVGALDRTDKVAATQKLLDHLKTVEKEK
ncbi:CarD family transcriptional regulator [Roseomonas nepalensis]|uniref:CarD family transcriptional regulator n=2 Tax=Muricoccus nepalensis TaxID=1854500 RepID=A0A502FG48_9PROT|nr:CarD family transcriptional regulator [Roseomonas nepalensis]